jgi:hypothetical protein
MTKDYQDRRLYKTKGWSHLLDDDDKTAWIDDGDSGGQKVFTLPETVLIEGQVYSLVSVEMGAFFENPVIEELIVPDCYEYIDNEAFHCCKRLKRVRIGKGLQTFCFWSFTGCPLEEVVIDPDNPYIKLSNDGRLILSKDGKRLYFAPYNDEEIVVPEGVETLGDNSLSCHQSLQRLTLPGTLKTIESEAIAECRKLKELIIPEGVTTIKDQAFRDCDELGLIFFPSPVKDKSPYQ